MSEGEEEGLSGLCYFKGNRELLKILEHTAGGVTLWVKAFAIKPNDPGLIPTT